MSFQDRIAHAAAVTKWKADQQMRLFKSQSKVSELENEIRNKKSVLAEKALALYVREPLAEDELNQICALIAQLHGQKEEQFRLQEATRGEVPPEAQTFSASFPTATSDQRLTESQPELVCPECHRPLVEGFCPEHHIEAIQTKKGIDPVVCSKCGQPLGQGKLFCGNCGFHNPQAS